MAAVGIFIDAAMWERALLGAADGSLAWGPALFRILLVVHGATLIAFALRPRKRPSKGLRLIELSSGGSSRYRRAYAPLPLAAPLEA